MSADRHRRAMELFLESLERTPSEREVFLTEACDGDEELRREAASLLRNHDADTLIARGARTTEAFRGGPGKATAIDRRPTLGGEEDRARSIVALRTAGWLGAVLFFVVALAGAWTYFRVRESIRQRVADGLQTILDADVAAIENWLARQKSEANRWAADPRVRIALARLIEEGRGRPAAELQESAVFREVLESLRGEIGDDGVRAIYAIDREGTVVFASDAVEKEGLPLSPEGAARVTRVFQGETIVTHPFLPGTQTIGADSGAKAVPDESPMPLMAVAAPVRDATGRPFAALALTFEAGSPFAALLNLARAGKSGETYALSREGVMLSESRFDLAPLGLLSPDADCAACRLRVADPGGNLAAGFRPTQSSESWRTTEMAASIGLAQSGVNMDGYRDYRGVEVVGVWRWLKDYQFGVATEVDCQEAFAPLRFVDRAFAVLLAALLTLTAVASCGCVIVAQLRSQIHAARRLGQYTLEELIGEGGMGKVYKARHALLKRPTAVKVLNRPDDPDAGARFEREVQAASQLTHPNTVQIYDFGHTAEGVFFYAMEYLPGITLEDLVAREGALPPARAACILRQVCGSLEEAHGLGMVHRDVKPANIMLCRRGGRGDVAKVLDFGLVKILPPAGEPERTETRELRGTPLYIAPERIRDPALLDPRSDLYSVGAVAVFLLTGRPVFGGAGSLELLQQTLHDEPSRPAAVQPDIPPEFDRLVMECLARDPAERPATIGIVRERLAKIAAAHPWTAKEADAWWERYEAESNQKSEPVVV